MDDAVSKKLWQESSAPADARAAIDAAADALSAGGAAVGGALGALTPVSKLLVGGASAIQSTARAFMGRADIRWADQVTVVADAPAERQLAGLCALFLGAARPTTIRDPSGPADQDAAVLRIVSQDASPGVRAALLPGA